jgi:hypothetical protein
VKEFSRVIWSLAAISDVSNGPAAIVPAAAFNRAMDTAMGLFRATLLATFFRLPALSTLASDGPEKPSFEQYLTRMAMSTADNIELTVSFNAQAQPVYDRTIFERLRSLKFGDEVQVRVSMEKLTGHTLRYVIKYEIKVGESGTSCKSPQYQPHEKPYPTSCPAKLGCDFAPQVALRQGPRQHNYEAILLPLCLLATPAAGDQRCGDVAFARGRSSPRLDSVAGCEVA